MKRGLIFPLVLLMLILPVMAAEFTDVPADHWAASEISRAADAGVVTGYAGGTFRPTGAVTGAHFCTFLSRSILAEEYAAQRPDNSVWWMQAVKACEPVLTGTSLEDAYKANLRQWGDFVNQPLSRYDMATILCNILSQKGANLPSLEERLSIQGKIGDWNQIPGRYQMPVATCYFLNLLSGQSDGTFGGSNTLSRAQACVVWSRLCEKLNYTPAAKPAETETPAEAEAPEEAPAASAEGKEMPAFGLQGEETVQQMMTRINAKTPSAPEGCLANGKPRTTENVLELLELVKEGCPDGTVWTSVDRYEYRSPRMGVGRGCLSFGMAVSDFLFGENATITMNRQFSRLAAGDMIHIKAGGGERVLILTGVDQEAETYTACELAAGEKIDWSAGGTLDEFINMPITNVYSRW